jgi:hypothetical protein
MAFKLMVQEANTQPNVVVYGEPMSGKTTYVDNVTDREKTLYISTDGNALPGCKIARVENWDDLIGAIEYALGRDDMDTVVLDVLDDAVAFAEKKAQARLGMQGKTDAKGGYGKFTTAVCELVKEDILRPLLMDKKQTFVVMHSAVQNDGTEVPCFGTYHRDALEILNWIKGRSSEIVRCSEAMGTYDAVTEAKREPKVPEKTTKKKGEK